MFCVRRLSGLSAALSERPQTEQPEEADRRNAAGRHSRRAVVELSAECQPVPAALRGDIDLPVFPAGRRRQPQLCKAARRRPRFSPSVDLGVNVLTLAVQLFLTGRILKRFGVGTTLSLLPLFSVLGFGAVGAVADAVVRGRISVDPARRQFCDRAADPRSPVHGAAARGSLQGQELYRHRGLSAGRSDRRLVVRAALDVLGLGLTQVSVVAAAISAAGWPIAGGSAAGRTCLRSSRKTYCRRYPAKSCDSGHMEFRSNEHPDR